MAAGRAADAIPSCVLCLSGIPGAGKSRLAAQIAANADPLCAALGLTRAPRVVYVCYDALMRAEAERMGLPEGTFDVGAWRASRVEAARIAREALREVPITELGDGSAACSSPPVLVVLDDNMHFRSMRKGAFHLAKECTAAFVHVHVDTPLQLALARNAARCPAERVPEHLLIEMARAYEAAPQETTGWERTTIVVRADEDVGDDGRAADSWTALLDPMELARQWRERQLDERDEAAALSEREASRQATLASALHRLDLRTRQAVAASLDAARDRPANEKRALAALLNEARRELLARVRQSSHAASAGQADSVVSDSAEGLAGLSAMSGTARGGARRSSEEAELAVDEELTAFELQCRAALSSAGHHRSQAVAQ